MNVVEPIRDPDALEYMCNLLKRGNTDKETKHKEFLRSRNHAMFVTGLYSGLRISDILKLKVKDVRNKKYIIMREQKTNKEKKFPINNILRKELDSFIVEREDYEYLFKSQKGKGYKPITYIHAWRIIKQVSEEADLQAIGTHSMRKTFGYHYYKNTKDIVTLQKIFNHSDPNTTLRYIGIVQNHIDEAYKNIKYF